MTKYFFVRFLVSFVIIIFSLSHTYVLAKEFSYEQSVLKMNDYVKEKRYKKALDIGLKIKKQKLTDEQKKELQEILEAVYFKKEMNDALKAFTVIYDKYEDAYLYKANLYVYDCIKPVIVVYKDTIVYFLNFKVEHYNHKRSNFDKVILNYDNTNLAFKTERSTDDIISYDTHKRIAWGSVILTEKEIIEIEKAAKCFDLSFKMAGDNSSVYFKPADPTKDAIRKSVRVYYLLKTKTIKPGDTSY